MPPSRPLLKTCVLPPNNHAYRKTARDWRTRRPPQHRPLPQYPGLPPPHYPPQQRQRRPEAPVPSTTEEVRHPPEPP